LIWNARVDERSSKRLVGERVHGVWKIEPVNSGPGRIFAGRQICSAFLDALGIMAGGKGGPFAKKLY